MRSQKSTTQNLSCHADQSIIPQMNTCNEGWRSEWVADLKELMERAEDAELFLSYLSLCKSQTTRMQIGSYYTPVDVAMFFWDEFMALRSINDRQKTIDFWNNHHFVEPAADAGIFVFTLGS